MMVAQIKAGLVKMDILEKLQNVVIKLNHMKDKKDNLEENTPWIVNPRQNGTIKGFTAEEIFNVFYVWYILSVLVTSKWRCPDS